MRLFSASSKAFLLFSFAMLGCSSSEPLMFGASSTGSSSSSGGGPLPAEIAFPGLGAVSGPTGKGSFRFGAASAATQIEDLNVDTDWYLWTAPKPQGLERSPFVGEASKGYTLSIQDIDLLSEMHLDSYRFSIEWARVEPRRNEINEEALKHYSDLIDALRAKNIRPMITIHHFSSPIWLDDPRDPECMNGSPTTHMCGLNAPGSGQAVIDEFAEHAGLLAARFGDRVDDWCTLNEPVNYLLAAYGAGSYPPGKVGLLNLETTLVPAIRNYIAAHSFMYDAIKQFDTVDADGDGVNASIGFTHAAQEWVAARDGMISDNPEDLAARERLLWVYQYMFVDSLLQGGFDGDFDGKFEEEHAGWRNTLDWVGVQYYSRAGVTGKTSTIPRLNLTPCGNGYDSGACIPAVDPTYYVPAMQYEHNPAGLYTVLADFHKRWPDLPLTVTESGIATEVGARRAEVVVRALEQIDKARQEGADVRGYYHWSIYDNFEWSLGFTPRFGLYKIDYTTYERKATEGATVLSEIAGARKISGELRQKYGGDGPLTPER